MRRDFDSRLPTRSDQRRPRCWRGGALAALLLAGLCGCSAKPPGEGPHVRAAGVAHSEIERGPVRVSVEVTPAPMRLSDEPTLTLTIDCEQGIRIEKPPFGDAVGAFIIRDFREPLPEIKDNREIVRQVYTLEPTSAGPQQIDPLAITFVDERPHGDGRRHTVETEALTVQVLSVVPSQAPSLDDLEGFAAPVDLPSERSWLGWLVAPGLLFCGVALGLWLLLRRRGAIVAQALSPREVAGQQLARLWSEHLAEPDVKLFYVRLTDVVRRYIEDTTGVRAPEETTEEFLRDIGQNEVFSREERLRLKEFLEAADLVKFAAHQPAAADLESSYQRACRFVGFDAQGAAA